MLRLDVGGSSLSVKKLEEHETHGIYENTSHNYTTSDKYYNANKIIYIVKIINFMRIAIILYRTLCIVANKRDSLIL